MLTENSRMEALELENALSKGKRRSFMGESEVVGAQLFQRENGKLSSTVTTSDGSTDRKGHRAIKDLSGGWKSAILLLVNLFFATFAFFGLGVNLVLFLRRVMHLGSAEAANTVSKWTGTVYLFSLAGAFLSDSYWGRYIACAIFQLIFVAGLLLLSLSSWLLLVKPSGCGDGELDCMPMSRAGNVTFYLAIYLMALGNGGYQPIIATFGADQFDVTDPTERRSKVAFFSYFYLALNLGSLFSNTFLAYFEDSGKWTVGFWTATGTAVLAFTLFFVGSPQYRHFRPCGNPLPRVAQVFVAASRKWDVAVPADSRLLFELEGNESAITGSRKIFHSDEFRFFDKAATITSQDVLRDGMVNDPWRLCTVTQVEEVKRVLKMLPIWLCTIIYSIMFTQMASLFVEQGAAMDNAIVNSHIPPAGMSAFDILSVAACVLFYRRVVVPVTAKISGNPKGPTELQRMGIGLVIGMMAMVTAGIVEHERLKRVSGGRRLSSLSILWQIPQYSLIGASEVFMYVGQLEFFNGQAPDGIKSFGSSLCMASMSLGNYLSSFIVSIIMTVTTKDESHGWIPEDLNTGHLDHFFFLLAILAAIDFVVYLLCARWYKYVPVDVNEKSTDMVMPEVV